jgi:hypothetical protein
LNQITEQASFAKAEKRSASRSYRIRSPPEAAQPRAGPLDHPALAAKPG